MNEFHAAALAYAFDGVYVFPVGRDKKPLTLNGFKDASITRDDVSSFWTRFPTANVAIDLERSGLIVVDVDGPEGVEPCNALHLPETRRVTTGRPEGGKHFVYGVPEGIELRSRKLAPGLEIKGAGGYAIAPPSIHASGSRYTSDGAPITKLTLTEAQRLDAFGRPEKPPRPAVQFDFDNAEDAALHAALKAIDTASYVWLLTGQDLNRRGFTPCPLPTHDDGDHDGGSFHACHGTGWRCFGCGASGDVFTLARALWGDLHFRDVRRRLADIAMRGGENA